MNMRCVVMQQGRNIDTPLLSRLILGGLAGLAGTAAMTMAMRRMHSALPAEDRYPLPPRELTEQILKPEITEEATLRDQTLLAHFAYGAASGALIAATSKKVGPAKGAIIGTAIWAGSYFGWAPALGILRPAHEHPGRRNGLMIGAHLVWGAVTALALNDFRAAYEGPMADGPNKDAAGETI